MKLIRKDFFIWKNDIYIIPTLRIFINNQMYMDRNLSIEMHCLVFHMRLFFTHPKLSNEEINYLKSDIEATAFLAEARKCAESEEENDRN